MILFFKKKYRRLIRIFNAIREEMIQSSIVNRQLSIVNCQCLLYALCPMLYTI